ncbi:trypsin-like peptidase domain-containing protein [Candidatus Woesearchaeota archaeon]|nr:trypsin-like peptidase domain-containing protein [Candidatus Woesearchaeota archaeon]
MLSKKTVNIMLVLLSVLILTGSVVYYFNYRIELMTLDYQTRISGLGRETVLALDKLQRVLQAQIAILGSNMSSQIGIIDTDLQNFKSYNQLEINTLSNIIDQIEKQSSIRLNELKDELKNIRIKSADFSAIVNDVLQSVVSIKTNMGQGSGAIIDAKGYIVTNVHVINDASKIKATTYSGNSYDVTALVGYDSGADIAVLKISAPDLRAINFGDSDEVKAGEKVIAAGNPAGLSFTVTEGIVSALRAGPNNIKYIQTDVPINPGNSGGPLINIKGEIIGINNFKVSGFESLGFAISSNNVKSIVAKIINDYEARQKQ